MDMMGTLFETLEDRNLGRLRQVLAGRHREWPITPRQVELLRRIEDARGLARIMGRETLCAALHCNRRELSADVQTLRLLGIGIGGSRDGDAGGYYMITNQRELDETRTPYLHQVTSMLLVIRALDRASFAQVFEQMTLPLFSKEEAA
jgi:hypothetical protein